MVRGNRPHAKQNRADARGNGREGNRAACEKRSHRAALTTTDWGSTPRLTDRSTGWRYWNVEGGPPRRHWKRIGGPNRVGGSTSTVRLASTIAHGAEAGIHVLLPLSLSSRAPGCPSINSTPDSSKALAMIEASKNGNRRAPLSNCAIVAALSPTRPVSCDSDHPSNSRAS
jgi:hypothetical protein